MPEGVPTPGRCLSKVWTNYTLVAETGVVSRRSNIRPSVSQIQPVDTVRFRCRLRHDFRSSSHSVSKRTLGEPPPEGLVDGRPGWKVPGQHSPGVAGAEPAEAGVQHLAPGILLRPPELDLPTKVSGRHCTRSRAMLASAVRRIWMSAGWFLQPRYRADLRVPAGPIG